MTAISLTCTPTWTRRGDTWHLTRHGRTLAVIEPSWSDHHSLLFLTDNNGELVHDATYGHCIARLRISLRFWFARI